MGIEVEIRLGPWDEVRKGLETGRIDVIHGMFFSRERDRVVDFSPPHTLISHSIFVRAGGDEISSADDLAGREVIVMRGDIMHDYIVDRGMAAAVAAVETQADALRLLASGAHDCALVAELPGRYWMDRLGLSNLEVSGSGLLDVGYCYAVAEGQGEVLSRFSEGLAILKQTGAYRDIKDKWLGVLEPAGYPAGRYLVAAALVVVPMLVGLGLALFWSWSLRRAVAARTQELAASEERFRTILENYPNGTMFVFDEDLRYRFADGESLRLAGLDPREMVGRTLSEVFPESVVRRMKPLYLAALEGRKAQDEVEFGGEIYDVHVLPLPDPVSGHRLGLGMAQIVTEARQAREALRASEERFRSYVENANDIIYSIDAQTLLFDYISPGWKHIMGHEPEEVVGTSFRDYVHPEDMETCQRFLEAVIREGRHKSGVEYRVRDASGRWNWHTSNAGPVRDEDGRVVGYLGIARDMTEAKRYEELKADIDRIMRHDLKTPLGNMISMASLLELEADLTLENQELVDHIKDQGQRMLAMINQSLDLYRMESGMYEYTPRGLDLVAVLGNVVRGMRTRAAEHGTRIEFTMSGRPVTAADRLDIPGDPLLLHSTFDNLVANALEATPSGAPVNVDISPSEDVCTVTVANQGEVPPILHHTFFDKYATHGKKGGLGLGTFSARLMVEIMGGSLGMETGDGLTVLTMTLPRAVPRRNVTAATGS
jgi:PAS domain S-box-containing protein